MTPAYWKAFALAIDQPDADAIFLSCGGIRALEVVEEIEQAAGKPVVTSNGALVEAAETRLRSLPAGRDAARQQFNPPAGA